MKKTIFLITLVLWTTCAQAEPPILVDRKTGKYLGNLSANEFDPNSTSNPFGRYGSEFSNDSPNNPYATNPPVIVSPSSGLQYPNGRLNDW